MKCSKYLAALMAATIISGCQTTGEGTVNKQEIGTMLGAIGGAILGSQFGEGTGQLIGVAIGTAAGSYIGSQIGASLDEQDRIALANSTQKALESGKGQEWTNPETGVSASVSEPRDVSMETAKVSVPVLKDKVQVTPTLELMQENYRFKSVTNVRGGPGADYVVVDTADANEVVNVVGKVKDEPWFMIARGGVGSGFVRTDLMEPASNEAPAPMAAPVGEVAQVEVSSERQCQTITQSVNLADGTSQSQDMRACRNPDGSFEMVAL